MNIKKKLMTSLLTMGLASALVGGATFAYFSASASNDNNQFKAGTIELGSSGSFGLTNIKPGDTGSGTITVTNLTSTLDSTLTMTGAVSLAQGADGVGDLGKAIKITSATFGGAALTIPDIDIDGITTLNDLDGAVVLGDLLAGAAPVSKDLVVNWEFVETGVEQNELQGDGVTINLAFDAIQK